MNDEGKWMSRDDEDFEVWMEYGIRMQYCGPIICPVHDGLPLTIAEEELIEYDELCIPMVRIYDSTATAKAVPANHSPSVWRNPWRDDL